jgi:hypothetical protein
MASTAILGSAVIGGISTMFGASKAAKAQTNAAALAAQTQMNMYNQTRSDLAPYRDLGTRQAAELERRMPELTSDINLDEELAKNSTVRQAYDFTNKQGLKAAQNSAAMRGLGVSGAALKGATAFTTGLAQNTYQNLFSMENTNRTNAYTRLKGLVDTGANAAGATGVAGVAAAKGASDAAIGAGNAQAAAYNAMGQAGKQFANDVGGYAAYKGLYGDNPSNPYAPKTGGVYDMKTDDVYF